MVVTGGDQWWLRLLSPIPLSLFVRSPISLLLSLLLSLFSFFSPMVTIQYDLSLRWWLSCRNDILRWLCPTPLLLHESRRQTTAMMASSSNSNNRSSFCLSLPLSLGSSGYFSFHVAREILTYIYTHLSPNPFSHDFPPLSPNRLKASQQKIQAKSGVTV